MRTSLEEGNLFLDGCSVSVTVVSPGAHSNVSAILNIHTQSHTHTRAQHFHTQTQTNFVLLWLLLPPLSSGSHRPNNGNTFARIRRTIPALIRPAYTLTHIQPRTLTHSYTHRLRCHRHQRTRSTRLAALSADQFVADLHQFLVLLALLVQLILHGRSRDLLALQVQPQLGVVRVMRARHHVQLVVGTGGMEMGNSVNVISTSLLQKKRVFGKQ